MEFGAALFRLFRCTKSVDSFGRYAVLPDKLKEKEGENRNIAYYVW